MEGSVFAPRLGLHIHVDVRDGTLVGTRICREGHGTPPPPELKPLLARIAEHCETGHADFRDVPLALDAATPFDRKVLTTLVREVAPGKVVTYGKLALMIGRGPGAARAIGGAMARNPMPIVVPCHRVVPSGARIGNYSGEGGWETKMKLLAIEGARGVWAQRQL